MKNNKLILVAEDSRFYRLFFCDLLTNIGFETIEATNGEEAIMLIENNRNKINFAFIDIEMPVLDGRETVRKLKKSFFYKKNPFPLVALTAHTSSENKEKLEKYGFDTIISKDCDEDMLKKIIFTYLKSN